MGDIRNKLKKEFERAQIAQWQAEERAKRERANQPPRCRCGFGWLEIEPMWWTSGPDERTRGLLECPRCVSEANKSLLIAGGVDPAVFDTGDRDARFTSITAWKDWAGLTVAPKR